MSSMDFDATKMHFKQHHPHHHHAMSANNIPTYASRNTPSYCTPSDEPTAQGNNLASPRYSPNIQPWKRQQAQNSLSFIPSTSPRPEYTEYTTAQQRRPVDRGSACISPFRSVRRMKQPFQLRLPASPSTENNLPSPISARDSRTPSGNHSLRTWRSDGNLMMTSLETFGLLPSPPLSDCRTSQASPTSMYFSPRTESDSDTDHGTPRSAACVSQMNQYGIHAPIDPPDLSSDSTNVHMAHSTLMKQYEPNDGKCTPMSMDSERMSSPPVCSDITGFGKRDFSGSSINTQRSRSGTISSEGSWAATSLSYCETWLQGAPVDMVDEKGTKSREVNRRKCQIVQQSPPPPARKREVKSHQLDDPVMFASVASKSKPKLVDISRQSSPAMSYSIPTPPQHPLPSTPDQRLQEISAFSPDTPLEMSDSGYITHNSYYSPVDSRPDKEYDPIDASSISSGAGSDTVVCNRPAFNQPRPKSMPKPSLRPKSTSAPKTESSHGSSSNPSGKEELEKWWDHEWTIDQLEVSVKDFPRNMLKLTSPVIMFLRSNNEKALIRPFRKIFPDVAENLLDSLCAALIARNYIVSLSRPNRRTSNFGPHKPGLSRLDTVPEKASSTLGIHYNQASPTRIKDRVLGSRSAELRKDLERIVDNLIFAICGKQDETLKSAVLVLAQVLETKS
ncbi:hypothetical protein FE257_008662 [Aspergillus nanangensis]|uniref:Uncharacterized protein n=1 Tax=Aspergillus nanangensis TaxID=2582783 RepID=A0AAD4CKV1_ASPNN|nr:hypothetical protein FE257_008662 [Aspergillus nanangensis]